MTTTQLGTRKLSISLDDRLIRGLDKVAREPRFSGNRSSVISEAVDCWLRWRRAQEEGGLRRRM